MVDGPVLLASRDTESLKLAEANSVKSIAFSSISIGVYGYPKREAVQIAVTMVRDGLRESARPGAVVFCCFGEDDAAVCEERL